MEILLVWGALSFVVGIAANARGRSGLLWFLFSLLLSPLIGLILVLVMRNLRQERLLRDGGRRIPAPTYLNPTRTIDATEAPKARWGGKASRVSVDRQVKPFEPDGIYAGIPYKVTSDGGIDANMQGATVRFATMDRFTAAVSSP